MTLEEREHIISTSWQLHSIIEDSYISDTANKDSDEWLEKQRILLADMALHLLQTALSKDDIKLDKLKNNLHAILTISDQFLPQAELKSATNKLFE